MKSTILPTMLVSRCQPSCIFLARTASLASRIPSHQHHLYNRNHIIVRTNTTQSSNPSETTRAGPLFTTTERKSLPIAFFTGNPHYYNLILKLNELIVGNRIIDHSGSGLRGDLEQDEVAFNALGGNNSLGNVLDTLKKQEVPKWLSMTEMATVHNMTLDEESYGVLVHKLGLLAKLKDPEIQSMLRAYIRPGFALTTSTHSTSTLDEHGRSITIGSRKTARAKVYLIPGDGLVYVNGTHLSEYFSRVTDREDVVKPFEVTRTLGKYNVWALTRGGGMTGQSNAIQVAIARGLTIHQPELKPVLEALGMTKIDRRQVERKKPGQAKARKKYAWVKR